MNAQTTTKTRRSQNPQHDETQAVNGPDTLLDEGTAAVIAEAPPKSAKAKSIFDMQRATVSEAAVAKTQAVGRIRQRLAEAADIVRESGEQSKEAEEISTASAAELYGLMRDGLFTREELTALLGDVFGYRQTPKGETSKTPNPAGDAIRKRVLRLWKAHEIVNNGAEPDNFFKVIPEEDIEEILDQVNSNSLSIWQAYNNLQDVKNEIAADNRVPPAFNPDAVAKLVKALSEKGTPQKLADNPALVTAYAALIDILTVQGQAAAALTE
jgi:hypothetical protein